MTHSIAAKIWYEQFDGKPQSPGWIITAYDKAIADAKTVMRERDKAALVEIITNYDCEQHSGPSSAFNALQSVWQKFRALPLTEPEGSQREGTLT